MHPAQRLQRIARAIEARIRDPQIEATVFQRSCDQLHEALAQGEARPGMFVNRLQRRGDWLFGIGLVETQPAESERALRLGLACQALAMLCDCLGFVCNPKKIKPQVSTEQLAFTLANALALGCLPLANLLGRRYLDGMQCGMFAGTLSPVATLVLGMWTAAHDLALPEPVRGARDPQEWAQWHSTPQYDALLQHWKTAQPPAFQPLLLAACDFHLAESHYGSDAKDAVFPQDALQLFPQEILAVLRLRREAGWIDPPLPHPLLQAAFCQMPEPQPVAQDALLHRIAAHLMQCHPQAAMLDDLRLFLLPD